MKRVARFYAVGLIGVPVQLAVLALLVRGFGLDALISTAIAVEIALVHNFFWHERWTWRCSGPGWVQRLCKFHVTNGLISIVANVLVTGALIRLGLPVLAANAIAIGTASVANYLSGEFFVFRVRE